MFDSSFQGRGLPADLGVRALSSRLDLRPRHKDSSDHYQKITYQSHLRDDITKMEVLFFFYCLMINTAVIFIYFITPIHNFVFLSPKKVSYPNKLFRKSLAEYVQVLNIVVQF